MEINIGKDITNMAGVNLIFDPEKEFQGRDLKIEGDDNEYLLYKIWFFGLLILFFLNIMMF